MLTKKQFYLRTGAGRFTIGCTLFHIPGVLGGLTSALRKSSGRARRTRVNDGVPDATDPSSLRPLVGRECPVCARFEVAWKFADSAAARPRIQDYVNALPETEPPAGLRTLLALQLQD